MRAYWALALALTLGASERAQAQTQVAARGQAQVRVTARVTIPDLLVLNAEQGQTVTVREGEFHSLYKAVTLKVSANRDWRLLLSTDAADPELEVRTSAESERVNVAGGAARPGAEREIANGSNGTAMAIKVGYRWKGSAESRPIPVYSLVAS
jgi:hypothetical protein